MVVCCVPSCQNRSEYGYKPKRQNKPVERSQSSLSFHVFPWDKKRRKEWADNIRMDVEYINKNTLICSAHFREDMFDKSLMVTRLHKHATPVLNLKEKEAIGPSKSVVVIEDSPEDMEIDVEQ